MARSWTMASAICAVQRMNGAFHAIFDQVLAGSFDGATGNRPTVGEVFVVAHSGAVAIEIVGDRVQRFGFGTGQAAFGDAMTDALDDLAHLAEQNLQGSVQDPKVGPQASLCMEDI